MKLELKEFEIYISSLIELGVYPTFVRRSEGWICVLRNGANKQLMPFNSEESSYLGETLMKALTVSIEVLNSRFAEPRDLHKYIETGEIRQPIEPAKNSNMVYAR
jgi:hypothetical protein